VPVLAAGVDERENLRFFWMRNLVSSFLFDICYGCRTRADFIVSRTSNAFLGASLPATRHLTAIRAGHGVSPGITALDVGATALGTVGVFASLYAGVLDPSVRVTSCGWSEAA
jgi:Alternate to MurJ